MNIRDELLDEIAKAQRDLDGMSTVQQRSQEDYHGTEHTGDAHRAELRQTLAKLNRWLVDVENLLTISALWADGMHQQKE